MSPRRFLAVRAFACAALLLPASAFAGEFAVVPVRLELGAAARSGAISVRNDDKVPLSFQMTAMSWTQDDTGRDTYTDSDELIFFPKIATIEPGQEMVIRVGLRQPVVAVEKTYRLFIQELARQEAPVRGQVQMLIRFGAPIFVKPAKPEDRLDVEQPEVARGVARLRLRNGGNQHQMFESVQVTGTDRAGQQVLSMQLADRYLLAGVGRTFSVTLAPADCGKLASLTFAVKTDKSEVRRSVDLTPQSCS